jgi:hypothetical protein
MVKRRRLIRLAFHAAYVLVAWAFLEWYYSGDSLCGEPIQLSVFSSVLRLLILVTVLDVGVGQLARWIRKRQGDVPGGNVAIAGLSALVIAFFLFFLPEWVFKGYGHFRFEGTAAELSCLLTEGYGMAFPFIVAPALSFLTFTRELLVSGLTSPGSR